MKGPIHRKKMLPLGPESGRQPGLRLRGRLASVEGLLGEQMGKEGGNRQARGLCHHLLQHPRPQFGFWAEPGFKKSNTSSLAISRALFPREPAVPGPGWVGTGMPCPFWDADRQGAMGNQVGRTSRAVLFAGPALLPGGGGGGGEETRGSGPFLWLLCHPGTDLLPARSLGQLTALQTYPEVSPETVFKLTEKSLSRASRG